MELINGNQIAASYIESIRGEVAKLKEHCGLAPQISFVRVGEDPASISYVKKKRETAEKCGIQTDLITPNASISEEELLALIDTLNNNPQVNGILVQTPLPPHIDTSAILNAVDPQKDVDGFNAVNAGRLLQDHDENAFIPCTPLGVLKLIESTGIQPKGKHVVIVGRSQIVSKPLATLFLQKKPWGDATVTVCHRHTADLGYHTRMADILVVATGQVNLVTEDMVKAGAVVIDVGNNRNTAGKLVGDVDFEGVSKKAGFLTPVPGGVGPMTVTMLMSNTLLAFKRQKELM